MNLDKRGTSDTQNGAYYVPDYQDCIPIHIRIITRLYIYYWQVIAIKPRYLILKCHGFLIGHRP